MRTPKNEREFEQSIIDAIRMVGGYAKHIDCMVDGFPDTFVVLLGIVYSIEIKYGSLGSKISECMEITQPPVLEAMMKAGHSNVYIALCDGTLVYLLRPTDILWLSRSGSPMSALHQVATIDMHRTWPEEFVNHLLRGSNFFQKGNNP
jgi:hypothetical protein